jgi:hypothetical protein
MFCLDHDSPDLSLLGFQGYRYASLVPGIADFNR